MLVRQCLAASLRWSQSTYVVKDEFPTSPRRAIQLFQLGKLSTDSAKSPLEPSGLVTRLGELSTDSDRRQVGAVPALVGRGSILPERRRWLVRNQSPQPFFWSQGSAGLRFGRPVAHKR